MMPPTRSFLRRIFISPHERRPRAGWRLFLHTLLMLFFATVIVVIILTLRWQITNEVLFLALVTTAATWTARRYIDRKSFRSLGFSFDRHTLRDMAVGMLLPAPLFGLIYLFELSMGWIDFKAFAWEISGASITVSNLVGLFLLFIVVGYYEELLSRGYHLQNLVEGSNLPWGLFLSSAIFGALHFPNPNASWISFLGITAAGYFLAYGWIRTGTLWLSIGLHIGWNFFEGPIFGFPVSGQNSFNLIQHVVEGPTLITGGAFGPEAGLVVLPAMLLGAGIILVYTRNRTKS